DDPGGVVVEGRGGDVIGQVHVVLSLPRPYGAVEPRTDEGGAGRLEVDVEHAPAVATQCRFADSIRGHETDGTISASGGDVFAIRAEAGEPQWCARHVDILHAVRGVR